MSAHLIIVGGGQAAGQVIQTLTQKSFAGRITLVGDEPHPPYQRPPLSKRYLAGELEQARLYLRPRAFYAQKGVTLELGRRVTAIDRDRRRIVLDDGRELGYDALLLATGSRVRKLAVPGADLPGIHYLRTIADADGIGALMAPGKRLVVVGAGYIGLEVAAVARSRGLDVTVLEAADRVMARVVCAEVAQFYAGAHEAQGVHLVCGVGVREFVGDEGASAVITADGRSHACDFVVAGVGILPETRLAESAGLACDDGICVDEHARTSAADIYAAGDCTNHPYALVGRRIRLESVQNAVEQAKTAAATIAGENASYTQVPWFWSDQYDLKLQIAGLSQGYDRVVLRGDPAERRFAAYYLSEARLVAVDAVNSPKDFLLGKCLLAARATPDLGLLEDPSIDVDALGAASVR